MVEQVRLREMYRDSSGNLVERTDPVFAFGTHPLVTSPETQAHPVTSAKAVDNKLRVIMDELLVGNSLEEIACRGQVDEDSYDTVPLGSTPDDIAKCAVPRDVLPSSCKGDHVMCICKLDTGCGDAMKGEPVGVKDVNQDGAADEHRFITSAVGIKCNDIEVPIDPFLSYWNPSGDQQVPAQGGFDALGPAIVLVPAVIPTAPMGTPQFLPTNTMCSLTFASDVVDKQGNQVCAPPEGDITKTCSPGDMSAFTFNVEALDLRSSSVNDGDTGVATTGTVDFTFTAPLAATAASAVTVSDGTTAFTDFTVAQPFPNTLRVTWGTGGLAANTMYTVTFGTGVADLYNQPVPAPITLSFTTAP